MYPWEIDQFILSKNGLIGDEDIEKLTSTKDNPQLRRITFYPHDNHIEMWDEFGNHYEFSVLLLEKDELNLVRKKTS